MSIVTAKQENLLNAQPYENEHFSIHISHLPTGQKVQFDGWVTGFGDNFSSDWKGTPVYGRMDDLYTFQKTGRKISIAFDVVARDDIEAANNHYNLNLLAKFLYPLYSSDSRSNRQILAAAPLLSMSWSGLVKNASDNSELVGFLQGFSYTPNLEDGQFLVQDNAVPENPTIIYQRHQIQLEYTVLHTHLTGWVKGTDGQYRFGSNNGTTDLVNFPHAIGGEADWYEWNNGKGTTFHDNEALPAEQSWQETAARNAEMLENR